MCYVLRNGLVHSFTLKPNRPEGRTNSILLSHNAPHFFHRIESGFDTCIFNAFTLTDDLCKCIDMIYELTKKDNNLQKTINAFWNDYPPIGKI